MNDERTLGELQAEADQAAALLENEVFNKAFQSMNQNNMDQILTSSPDDKEGRERLYLMFQCGQLFVQQFAAMINNTRLINQPTID